MTPSPSVIRHAIPTETPFLNELTGRSVLSWGYEPEFLDWEPEAITVTSEFVANSPVFVLEDAGRSVGYYGLLGEPPEMALDKLFVEPDRIGTGCGKHLWLHAVATAGGTVHARPPHAAGESGPNAWMNAGRSHRKHKIGSM
jgi:hypothetical protein